MIENEKIMKRILYILCAGVCLVSMHAQAQTRKILKMKKEGKVVYSKPLDKVETITVDDTWNFLGAKGKSLFREMLSRPDLSKFVQVVRSAGYDFVLDAPTSDSTGYYVVAPTNSALSFLTQENLLDSTAMRTFAREYISNAPVSKGKTLVFLNNNQVANSFSDSISCHNGVLSLTSKLITKPAGILDLLVAQPELNWFYAPLDEGEVIDQGSEVRLNNDVVLNSPADFIKIGPNTTTLVPVEDSYNAFMNQYMNLFHVPDALSEYRFHPWMGNPLTRALSVEGCYTSYAEMPEILTLANTGQKIAKSNLKLTGNPLVASDGVVFPLSEVPFSISDLYCPILTEAEDRYRMNRLGSSQPIYFVALDTDTLSMSPLSTGYKSGQKYNVSGGRYARFNQSAARAASIYYGVSNTLSGAYDLWVTFIPASMVEGVEPKPSSVQATITYSVLNDSKAVDSKTLSVDAFEIDPRAVTRIKVACLPDLEICYDGFLADDEDLYNPFGVDHFGKKYGVKILLRNTSSVLDVTKDHNLYIDCIELIPRPSE